MPQRSGAATPTSARVAIILLFVLCGCPGARSGGAIGNGTTPASTTLAELAFPLEPEQPAIKTWIVRAPQADGSTRLTLHAVGAGRPSQTLTVVPPARDSHHVPDAELGEITSRVFDLPDGQRAIRIDIQRVTAGAERTETTLVGFRGGELHRLLEITSGSVKARSPSCRESTETSLRLSAPGRPVILEAMTYQHLVPVAGVAPIEATCAGKRPIKRSLFKLEGDRLVEIEEDDHD